MMYWLLLGFAYTSYMAIKSLEIPKSKRLARFKLHNPVAYWTLKLMEVFASITMWPLFLLTEITKNDTK